MSFNREVAVDRKHSGKQQSVKLAKLSSAATEDVDVAVAVAVAVIVFLLTAKLFDHV